MPTRQDAPLYDTRFEHDACGIGFVADAGGRSVDRVLPLALAGLAALGHRGAFGADGESSDGAGISLPLEPSVVERLAPGLGGDRPGIVQLFLPRPRHRRTRSAQLVRDALADAGLELLRWRPVPTDPGALGSAAAASRPEFAQAVVARPDDIDEIGFERRLAVVRRRIEAAARRAGEDALAAVEAECCGGCSQTLTVQMLNLLKLDKAVFCMSCGRMLYLPE